MARKNESPDPHGLNHFFYVTIAIIILLLSLFNLQQKKMVETKVLGIKTQTDESNIFWSDFLDKHPDYLPALKEIGDTEKVLQIDPNYFK